MDDASRSRSDHAADLAADLMAAVGKLKRRMREQASAGDLTPSQTAVLLHLEKGPATASSLARAEGMRPQSMATVIASLEAAGFVRGAPDPSDGRQTLLSMTDACRLWLAEGRAARRDWLSRTLAERLTPEEQHHLAGTVALFRRLLDD